MKNKKLINRIIELFQRTEKPLQRHEIAREMSIKFDSPDYENLRLSLEELCTKGILQKSTRRRYTLVEYEKDINIIGTVHINKDRGVVETNLPDFPKITIRWKDLFTALDGDTVKVKPLALKKGKKPRGEIIEIVKRNQAPIVGTIEFDGSFYFLIPDEEKYYVDFLISHKNLKGAGQDDKVKANFLAWNHQSKSPQAEVIEIIGKAGEASTEFESVIKEFVLPVGFSDAVTAEAKQLSGKIDKKVLKSRFDLRKKDIITIDPFDAKDFDDALSLDILENGNYLLGVHIADVSHYVTENSEIDIEARFRGTSTYLVDRVIPMLPEELSNEICSLKPKEDRLAFTVMMEFTPRGALKNYEIHESVINSKRRFTYEEVQQIIETGIGDYEDLISNLHKLATILRKKRFKKGGIDFETFEVKFILDDEKNPTEAVLKKQTDSTSLVEECMLAANEVVAGHVKKLAREFKRQSIPYLYRIHEEPDPKQLKDTLNFIASFGHSVKKKDISSRDINQLLESIKNSNEKYIVNQVMIRTMAKAIYSTDNVGHYGLGFAEYTHFTSPIRRYPDLMIHSLIKEYSTSKVSAERFKYLSVLLKEVAKQSSERERLALDAERQSLKLAGTILAKSHIGEEFTGTVSGVTNFGVFVFLDEIYVEGILHVRDLDDDYYIFDDRTFSMIGRHHKKRFNLGKKINVKIINVNIEKRRIELRL